MDKPQFIKTTDVKFSIGIILVLVGAFVSSYMITPLLSPDALKVFAYFGIGVLGAALTFLSIGVYLIFE